MPAKSEAVYARTVELADPGPLTAYAGAHPSAIWLRQGDGLLGLGRFAVHHPPDPSAGSAWWKSFAAQVIAAPQTRPAVAFGTFLFDPQRSAAQATMIVPELLLERRQGRAWMTLLSSDPSQTPELPAPAAAPRATRSVAYADGALSSLQWESAVAAAVKLITGSPELNKIVLARDLYAQRDPAIDTGGLAANLASDYPNCWTFAVDGLIGATPEMLVRRFAGQVTSRVLAGTIWATGGNLDAKLAAALAESSKNRSEHHYSVRSVAEALAPYCTDLQVPDTPYVLELPNVFHLATDVTARARPEVTSLELAAALHPSAAVCGSPTAAAAKLINQLEQMDRGRYAGPVGWTDSTGDGEWGIALRCGQVAADDPTQIRLFAGCGIVADSQPESELAESNAKLVPMRDALAK